MDAETRAVGIEDNEGLKVGRDPLVMTAAELTALGHAPMSAQKALRLRCLDCCAGSSHEVKLCVSVACPSWPFRLGRSPWKAKREMSPEHLALLAAARARRLLPEGNEPDDGEEGSPDGVSPENAAGSDEAAISAGAP